MTKTREFWIVTSELFPWPMGAFGSKREVVKYLNEQPTDRLIWLHAWQCDEGKRPVEVDLEDLIGCFSDPGF